MGRKYGVKTKSRMIIIFLVFLVVICTLSYTLFLNVKQIVVLEKEMDKLTSEKNSLELEEVVIKEDINRLEDPVYIARFAREKYYYSKEGEIILRIK